MSVLPLPSRPDEPDEPGESGGLSGLDVTATLLAAERVIEERHRLEVDELEVVLHWAVLHGDLVEPGVLGGDRLVLLGGEGTPLVRELPVAELAVVRRTTIVTTQRLLADALDLAFRLPGYYATLQEGRGQVWVGRKIATRTRHLTPAQVARVDAAITAAADQPPGRLLTIAEAAVLRAEGPAAREEEAERRRHREVHLGRVDEVTGLGTLFARLDAGDLHAYDQVLGLVADALADRPDLLDAHGIDPQRATRAQLRAEALTWLAHPTDVLALLDGSYQRDDQEPSQPSSPHRQKAVLHVHLAEGWAQGDVARVEELGPTLVTELARLLGHHRIDLQPVIDLAEHRSVNSYEFPADIATRAFLRTTGDTFPHATSQSRRVDNDHPDPYDDHGPPGQTGDHNMAPLGRRGHRAKTHLGYLHHQIGPGRYLWRTPHGHWRLVDPTGTHVIDAWTARRLLGDGSVSWRPAAP